MGNLVAIMQTSQCGKVGHCLNSMTKTRQLVNEQAGTIRNRQYGKCE